MRQESLELGRSRPCSVPGTDKGPEPLCAAYSKRCLPMIELYLKQRKFAIRNIYNLSRIKTISEKTLRQHDPELASFFNINTPDDLKVADERAAEGRNAGDGHR